jgi:hypothetical protein
MNVADNTVKLLFDLSQAQQELIKAQNENKKLREAVKGVSDESKKANDSLSKSASDQTKRTREATRALEGQKKEARELAKSVKGIGGEIGKAFGEERIGGLTGQFGKLGLAAAVAGVALKAFWETAQKDADNFAKSVEASIGATQKFKDEIKTTEEKSGTRGLATLETERNLIAATGDRDAGKKALEISTKYGLKGGFTEAAGLMTQAERARINRKPLTSTQKLIAIEAAAMASQSGAVSSNEALEAIMKNPALGRVLKSQYITTDSGIYRHEELAARVIRMKTAQDGQLQAISGQGTRAEYKSELEKLYKARTSDAGSMLRRLETQEAISEGVDISRRAIGESVAGRDFMQNVAPGKSFMFSEAEKQQKQEEQAYVKEEALRKKQSEDPLKMLLYLNQTAAAADASRAIQQTNSAALEALMRENRLNTEERKRTNDVLEKLATAISERGAP